jgi:hypothetical protein
MRGDLHPDGRRPTARPLHSFDDPGVRNVAGKGRPGWGAGESASPDGSGRPTWGRPGRSRRGGEDESTSKPGSVRRSLRRGKALRRLSPGLQRDGGKPACGPRGKQTWGVVDPRGCEGGSGSGVVRESRLRWITHSVHNSGRHMSCGGDHGARKGPEKPPDDGSSGGTGWHVSCVLK